MRLKKLTLRNYGCHRERTVDFGDMTLILGPNGAGKSTLLDAIVFALTGEERSAGVLADAISLGSFPGESSYAQLEFTASGRECMIKRHLTEKANDGGPKQLLTVSGYATQYTKAANIRDTLTQLLGSVDLKLFLDYAFPAQCRLFDFLDSPPKQRAALFNRLFGLERAEKIYSVCQGIVLPTAGTDLVAALQAENARLTELREQSKTARSRQFELANLLSDGAPTHEQLETWWRARERYNLVIARLHQSHVRRQQLEKDHQAAQEKYQSELSAFEMCQPHVGSAKQALQQARDQLTALAVYEQQKLQADRLNERLRGVQMRIDAMQHPSAPADLLAQTELPVVEGKLTHELFHLQTAQAYLSRFKDADKTPNCPLCQSPVTNPVIQQKLCEHQEAVLQLGPKLEQEQKQLDRSRSYHTAMLSYHQTRDGLYSEGLRLRQQISEAGELAVPNTDREKLQKSIRDGEEWLAGHAQLHQRVGQYRVLLELAVKSLGEVKCFIATDEAEVRQLQALGLDLTDAGGRKLQQLREQQEEYQQLVQRTIPAVDQEIEYRAKKVADIEERQQQEKKARDVSQHMLQLRQLFHREALPAEVARFFVNRMLEVVNDNLAVMNTPFRCMDFQDYLFRIEFTNGWQLPANRLSIGQKVLLALAVLVAVNSLFATELGLLCLDEPTAGLSRSNQSCLPLVLEQLRKLSSAKDIQLLVVTHSPGLEALCDQVITLPAPT